MQQVEYFRWWLPPALGRKKPYLSTYLMTADEAAARGALRPEPGTRQMRDMPETEDERRRAHAFYQSAGRDSVQPPVTKEDPPC